MTKEEQDTADMDCLRSYNQGYENGKKNQRKIDEIKYNKLRELAMDMYTAMQYLSTDTRNIREKMEKFHHFIIYESKAMEE